MTEKHPTICIIDDNPEDREVFRRYLLQDTLYAYQFYEEETADAGLALCLAVQPDCILLDYKLPDGDGLEFLAALADENGSMPFAVVMLAGLDNEDIALQAMKAGAQDYLVKNEMTPGNLFRAIHNAIERSAMRRTLEKQRRDLEMKNQEMQAFAYALAHDLRAPLRAISGFSQILEEDYSASLDGDGRHYVHTIVNSCGQMDHLIEDLLNYTRIEHSSVHYKRISLQQMLLQIVEDLTERIVAIQATVSIAPATLEVYGDPTLMKQILVNLLENALTYRRADVSTQITITWKEEQQYVIIAITDNGLGLAPKHYERIFNIFQRLHSNDLYPGTGIGLAIVRKATELMGGQVWVESELGVGSTFFVKFLTGNPIGG